MIRSMCIFSPVPLLSPLMSNITFLVSFGEHGSSNSNSTVRHYVTLVPGIVFPSRIPMESIHFLCLVSPIIPGMPVLHGWPHLLIHAVTQASISSWWKVGLIRPPLLGFLGMLGVVTTGVVIPSQWSLADALISSQLLLSNTHCINSCCSGVTKRHKRFLRTFWVLLSPPHSVKMN